MTRLDHIEAGIAALSDDELTCLSAWFESFQAARFDQAIEMDATAGRLDELASEARRE